MISKNLKVFEINGRTYQFNIDEFRLEFARKAAKNNYRIGEYEQMLADNLFVSRDSVHNWRQKLNGPGDMDKIKKIAEFLRCDTMHLMTDVTEENTNGETLMNDTDKITLNDRHRDAVKRVYLAMLDFIDGEIWSEERVFGSHILDMIEREFIDIPLELWNELTLYYWEKIHDLYRWKETYNEVAFDWIVAKCEEDGMSPEEIDTDEVCLHGEFIGDIIVSCKDSLRKTILPYL